MQASFASNCSTSNCSTDSCRVHMRTCCMGYTGRSTLHSSLFSTLSLSIPPPPTCTCAQILTGHSTDHVTPAGSLITVFSAPDYPQFQDGPSRYNNLGAVAVLSAPGYCDPAFVTFEAAKDRPQVCVGSASPVVHTHTQHAGLCVGFQPVLTS